MTNIGAIPTTNLTYANVHTKNHPKESSPPIETSFLVPCNDVMAPLVPTNAYGDMIVAPDDSSSYGNDCLDPYEEEEEDTEEDFLPPPPTPSPRMDTCTAAPPDTEDTNNCSPCTIHPQESLNMPLYSDKRIIPMLRMMSIVRKRSAPLIVVDEIASALKEEWQMGRLSGTNLSTDRTAIKRIKKMFPTLPVPISVTINHERTIQEIRAGVERPSISFPIFSFLGQLNDLLSDHVFSQMDNLVIDPSNRWGHYQRNSCPHLCDEIQDGDCFQHIVQSVESNPSTLGIKEFIFGIQSYVDKTGTDALQRTSVEPLVFTLTLLSNQIRNQPKYWRVLALLPSSSSKKQLKKYVFGGPVRNYHVALKAALEEFIFLQQHPPIVQLRLGDQVQRVRARLFWINIIADAMDLPTNN